MSLPETVVSERLTLRLVTPEDAEGMLAGRRRVSWHPDYPRKDDQDAAAMVKAGDPQAGWGPRHIVRSGDGLVVGSIGFFGAPAPVDDVEEAEVGFGLVEDARGHGAVTEALSPCSSTPTGPAYASGRACGPRTAPACGCWPSAVSPSCAARPRRASW